MIAPPPYGLTPDESAQLGLFSLPGSYDRPDGSPDIEPVWHLKDTGVFLVEDPETEADILAAIPTAQIRRMPHYGVPDDDE